MSAKPARHDPAEATPPVSTAAEPFHRPTGAIPGEPIHLVEKRTVPPVRREGPVRLAGGAVIEPTSAPRWNGDGESTGRWFVVRFEGPVRDSWRRALAKEGFEAAFYLPPDALVIRAAKGRAGELATMPGVSWIVPYDSRLRTAPSFAESLRTKTHPGGERGPLEVVALLFPGADAAEAAREIEKAGGTIGRRGESLFEVSIPPGAAADLAAVDEIRWIEPKRPVRFFNRDCQWVVQSDTSNSRPLWNEGLTGAGVLLSLCDSGIRTTHDMFRDDLYPVTGYGDFPLHRKLIAYWKADSTASILFGDDSGAAWHGTHTSCTAAGNDAPGGSSADDGIAPDAKILFVDAGGSTDEVFLPPDLGDLFRAVYDGNSAGAPRILSNSWGALQGGVYDYRCEQVDRFVWEHDDFLVLFSNGNGSSPNTVGSPAVSKNVISVGGTENGSSAGQIYGYTSRGPTDDGRLKPTLCAPARLASASGAGDGLYQTLEGTSMATPAVAGAAALIRQYFIEGWYPTGIAGASPPLTPSAALLKAVLVASGEDDVSGYTIPSNDIGWGRIRVRDALYFPGDTRRLAVVDQSPGIMTGEQFLYQVNVVSTAEPLEIALVWNDYPSSPAAAVNLVNDLNLTVSDGVTSYRGNVFSGGVSIAGGSVDSLNVEEEVLVPSPGAGTWTITVEGFAVPFGPQPFALVVTGALDGSAGSIALDKGSYGGADTVRVSVEDGNETTPPSVTVRSDTEPAGETIVLQGSGGVFSGTIATSTSYPMPGDGVLAVSQGDSIRVAYNDASPAATASASATVRLDGPQLTSPSAIDLSDIEATVRWTSTAAADSRVIYGLDPAGLSDTAWTTELVTSHTVALHGLVADTTYYYRIESTDIGGNRTTDDGGAFPYRLTTTPRSDVLLVIGDPTFERTDHYENAFARNGWSATVITGTVPAVGDRKKGLRSYPLVIWQAGWEQYPPFSQAARDTVTRYLDGGGRLMVVSHDAAWALGDAASPYYTAQTASWLESALKIEFGADPSYWNIAFGASGDPISGAYTLGVSYTPFRSGGAGDEVTSAPAFTGTVNTVWKSAPSYATVGTRWTDAGADGNPDSAVWGGTPSKGVTCNFEWAQLSAATSDDPTRATILDKTLIWLAGRDHPGVTLQTMTGGETITAAPVSIDWAEAMPGGAGDRRIEWSGDGGSSWNVITTAAGAPPYSWDLAGVSNGTRVRVRVIVADGGNPPLHGTDASTSDITVALTGNDARGPRVIAGSPAVSPNPVDVPGNVVLTATVTDSLRGSGPVTGAEWSAGTAAAPAGTGTPLHGAWGGVTVTVRDTLDATLLTPPSDTIWIRAVDGDGNWGEAYALAVTLRGDFTAVPFAPIPIAFRLYGNSPNPFNPVTTIRYDLPREARIDMRIYSPSGRLVRRLVSTNERPGTHVRTWDGRNDAGRDVSSGVYLLRLEAGTDRAVQKMMLIR